MSSSAFVGTRRRVCAGKSSGNGGNPDAKEEEFDVFKITTNKAIPSRSAKRRGRERRRDSCAIVSAGSGGPQLEMSRIVGVASGRPKKTRLRLLIGRHGEVNRAPGPTATSNWSKLPK